MITARLDEWMSVGFFLIADEATFIAPWEITDYASSTQPEKKHDFSP